MSDLNVGIVGLGWVAGAHIETAFYSHKVAFAADLSAKSGRPVKLSEMD